MESMAAAHPSNPALLPQLPSNGCKKAYHNATSEEAQSRTLDAAEGEVLSLSSSYQKRGPSQDDKIDTFDA